MLQSNKGRIVRRRAARRTSLRDARVAKSEVEEEDQDEKPTLVLEKGDPRCRSRLACGGRARGSRLWLVQFDFIAECLEHGGGGGAPMKIGSLSLNRDSPQPTAPAPTTRRSLPSRTSTRRGINGRQLQLVNYDDASDAKQAVTIATRLVTQDKVTAVVSGSYSDRHSPLRRSSSAPAPPCWQLMPSTPAFGHRRLHLPAGLQRHRRGQRRRGSADQHLGAKKVAIVAIKNDFGTSLVQGFTETAKALGVTIVATDYNQFGEKDFTPILSRDKSRGAVGFFMVEYAAEAQQFINN